MEPLTRRNYVLHCTEGGLYMGGLAFVAAETILPPVLNALQAPDWIISFTPQLLLMCMFGPGILATPVIERLPRLFPFVVTFGVFQRLPYLLAALALALFYQSHPQLVFWIVVLTPVLSGLAGSLAIPAWMEMVTRMIPERKRASGWAIRYIIGATVGIAAGQIVRWILDRYPGVPGYAMLHGCAFAFLASSLVVFSFLRETNVPPRVDASHTSYRHLLAVYGRILRTPSPFRRMLLVRVFGYGFFVLAPFLSIHALETTGRPESMLGTFVTVQMIGGICGNFVAGWLGDRLGGKATLVAAKSLQLVLCLLLVFNTSFAGFLIGFFLFGMGHFLLQVGDFTLGVEVSPRERRTPHLALFNFSLVPGSLLAGAMAWGMHGFFGSYAATAVASAGIVSISLAILATIPEPRISP